MPDAPSPRLTLRAQTTLPTVHGDFVVRAYDDALLGATHLALTAVASAAPGTPADPEPVAPTSAAPPGGGEDATTRAPLVRVHSECLTGEALGSLKCECGPQLRAALDLVHAEGGTVVYLRGHEGRGIGLVGKLRAYAEQERGLDTVDANTTLGFAPDEREYGAAALMLRDLGLTRVRLLTNNPAKIAALEASGIAIAQRVPLIVGETPENATYLRVKRTRMGHLLTDDRLQ